MGTKRTVGAVSAAAGAGAGTAGSLAVILVWVISLLGVEVPSEVAAALATVIGAAGAVYGGYLVPSPGTGKRVADDE